MQILLMEGNTAAVCEKAAAQGVRTASETYIRAIHTHFPQVDIDVVNSAEGEFLPAGKHYTDYDGLVVSGSSLHAYDQTPEVLNQIENLKRFAATGKPILGSCWGLQIATVAAGGRVEPSANGRELGIARKIALTDAGRRHPLLAGKPAVHDAPCIHYDEVVEVPANATVLSGNRHSPIQAAIVPLGASEVWGIQYHPEFDITQLRMLFELYREEMLKQGFVQNEQAFVAHVEQYRALEMDPTDQAVRWQLGIDDDILDARVREAEIINWLSSL